MTTCPCRAPVQRWAAQEGPGASRRRQKRFRNCNVFSRVWGLGFLCLSLFVFLQETVPIWQVVQLVLRVWAGAIRLRRPRLGPSNRADLCRSVGISAAGETGEGRAVAARPPRCHQRARPDPADAAAPSARTGPRESGLGKEAAAAQTRVALSVIPRRF